jgi:hypothetical protein
VFHTGLEEMPMRRVLPLFLLLAGCAGMPQVEATKMDQLQNTYELVARPGFLRFPSDQQVKDALLAKAEEVCGVGNVANLDTDRPDYIRVGMTPRGYLHCHYSPG